MSQSGKARPGRKRDAAIVRAQAALAPQPGSLPDSLREVGEHALVAVRRWADPRERELRRRRRARRRSFQLGTAGGLTTAGAVGLAVISAPAWIVVVIGGGAVAAGSGSAALHALAADVTAMEQALGAMGRSDSPAAVGLTDNLQFALARLDTGVAEYEQVVAAAGRILAVPESAVLRHNFDAIVADLRHAADRLDGWAQALTEVADQPSPLTHPGQL